MSVSQEAIRAQTDLLLRFSDTVILPVADRDDFVAKALNEYSRRRPLIQVASLTGSSTAMYELPSGWDDDFNQILEIEYPINSSPKQTIDERKWFIDITPSGLRLRFDQENPASGQTFWIRYTDVHRFSSDGIAEGVAEIDQKGIEFLAASFMSEALSTHFASKANPNLPEAQVFEYNSRVDEYSNKAKDWMKRYDAAIRPRVSGIIGNLDFVRDNLFDRERD